MRRPIFLPDLIECMNSLEMEIASYILLSRRNPICFENIWEDKIFLTMLAIILEITL